MSNMEYKEKLLQDLKEKKLKTLGPEDTFVAGCDRCGKCCTNRDDIILYPIDVFRLAKRLNVPAVQIAKQFCNYYIGQDSHLPILNLQYKELPGGLTVCPFLSFVQGKAGCAVDSDKPNVCRMYPLGRVSTSDGDMAYFHQEFTSEEACPGMAKAIRKNKKVKVSNWLGGREAMETSEKASKLFRSFITQYNAVYRADVIDSMDERIRQAFHTIIGNMMYHFRDNVSGWTTDDFLKIHENNLNEALEFAREIFENWSDEFAEKIMSWLGIAS